HFPLNHKSSRRSNGRNNSTSGPNDKRLGISTKTNMAAFLSQAAIRLYCSRCGFMSLTPSGNNLIPLSLTFSLLVTPAAAPKRKPAQ
ncbi:hypothetical protein, partial [Geobacillus sp. ZGt-1]|uniref:hypothetical protein n=1 Tax=Geobacillus sp. ZGt-1 TaxID=1631556 RepID=UPI001F1803F5